jgi:hypothetical protein
VAPSSNRIERTWLPVPSRRCFRIIERHAFEKEEPDPSRVQHQREHGAAAFRRGDANWQGLPALENK